MREIYLDNSATTRPTEAVADAMRQCMLEGFYNPSALYAPAVDSEKRLTACREAIARELHADPARVVFTSGGTEADNLAIFGSMSMQRGGRVLYTAGEHPAVAAPCESLKGTFDVQQIPYDAAGVVRLDALEELLTPDTRLICVMQVNNESGAVMRAVEELTRRGYTYEKDGAVWYKNAAVQTEALLKQGKTQKQIDQLELKDDVLVRANGFPTYFAADIAYHANKFVDRGYEKCINVWGADHHGHVARLKGAMDAIGLDGSKLDIVLMQLVRLMKDGEPYRMSKRTGKSITLSDLTDLVPIDAARFFFNMREPNSTLDFDLDLAVEESSQNPVYYVQYAHARICSILKNLTAQNIHPRTCTLEELQLLSAPEEKELIRKLAQCPQEIINAAKNYDPARMTHYLMDVATLFHKFYNACRVKGSEEALQAARLYLCTATRTVLENGLALFKVTAPESM